MIFALLPGLAADFLIAFGRIGALFMLLPALGERAFPTRQKLGLALLVTLMALPVAQAAFPVRSAGGADSGVAAIGLLVSEILIGLMLGISGRLVMAVMEMTGSFISQNVGLSFAQSVDPSQGQQGEVISGFLRMLGVLLIFVSDLHHVALVGIVDSYSNVPPGSTVSNGDALALAVTLVSATFSAACRLAAPFIVFGLVFNLGIGLAARLAPQIQLFFLTMPLAIVLGLMALGIVLGVTGGAFRDFAAGILAMLFPASR